MRLNLQQTTETDGKVFDAFHEVKKNRGDSVNRIVTRIFKKLEETISKKTIERHLKKNMPLMTHYFEPEQRGKKEWLIYKR